MNKGEVRKVGVDKKPLWFFETEYLHKAFVGEAKAMELITQGISVQRKER